MKAISIYKTTEVIKQTLDELVKDNNEFLEWLKEFYGEESREDFIHYLRTELSFVPRTGTKVDYPFIQMGKGSLTFYPYTTAVKYGKAKDPINLVFYKNGSPNTVYSKMLVLTPQWHNVNKMSSSQYTFIDHTQHGGQPEWVSMTYTMADIAGLSGLARQRKHIRIFGSSIGCNHNPGYGNYSIASVHEDRRVVHFLSPLDFDKSQLYIENAFSSLGCNIVHTTLQPPGEIINGIQHDGLATAIEI